MEGLTERVNGILNKAPTQAMSFSRLLCALREEGVDIAGREDLALKRMTEQPDSFRVIPDRFGPWARWSTMGKVPTPGLHARYSGCDPWILTCSQAPRHFGIEGQVKGRIQECLQAWGQALDDGSQRAVAGWIRANREAERVLAGFVSPEGRGF